jgi:hypothetical protein
MADVVTQNTLPDSRPLYRLIGRTRRMLRSTWVATGIGVTAGLLLGALAVCVALDLLVPLELALGSWAVQIDPVLRTVGLLLIVVPASLAFLQGVIRPLLRRLGPTQVAKRIESQMAGIHNRLVSAIDLQQGRSGGHQASPVFLRRLLNEALQRIQGFRASRVLDLASLRRALLLAGLAIGACLGMGFLFADRLPTALARLTMPWADIPPASGVAYDVRPGKADVLRDEEITFAAQVTRGDPGSLRLELYGGRGSKAKSYELAADRNDPQVYRTSVDAGSLGQGFEKGFRYRVFGGGTWSKQFTINLVERPVLVAVDTGVYYPAYMRIKDRHPTPPQAVEVTGPEGGEVEVRVQAQGEVEAADIQLLKPSTQAIARDKQVERSWFEDKLPVGVTPGGSWDWQTVDKRNIHTEPAALGTHGHWFQGDPVGLVVGKGDILYAYVRLLPNQNPETLMLEWHDGDGWEHRAFWGADRIKEGKPHSAGRYRAGNLPETGKWVRLEVPAAKVGLEGKTLRGVAFKLHGGQVQWGRTGTVQVEEPSVAVIKAFAMKPDGEGRWTGRFPLAGTGMFRAELRNPQGHPNKAMKELQYVALPDKPPYIALERQSNDLVLNKPAQVPLTIAAFDDYGIDEVAVLVRQSAGGKIQRRTLARPAKPERNLNLVRSLSEAGKLKLGGQLWYAVEVRDTKGQTARTPEFTVRVAADPNAADKQLDDFDKTQDSFLERLAKLIGDQEKVRTAIDKSKKEYADLAEKVKAREEAGVKDPGKADDPKIKAEDAPVVKLSPEEEKRLAELQKELAKLAGEEDKNAKAANQINEDIKKEIDKAGKVDLLPKPMVDQMKATQNAFDKMVAKAMKDLAKRLGDDADPKKGAPDLNDLKDRADRLDKEMKAVKDRLEALSKARKGLKDDLAKTLAALREKMLKEDGKLTARDLERLKDYIAKMREAMKKMRDKQDELRGSKDDSDVKKAKAKQEDLEKDLEKLLADAKKLLNSKRKKKDRDDPEFPDSPYDPEGKEEKVAPREEDTDEPLPDKKKKDAKKDKNTKDDKTKEEKDEEDDDEKKFMPRLGGKREKIDPRFAKKRRPVKRDPTKGDKENEDREKLADKQDENSRDLDAAEKSLKSDQDTLEKMIDAINKAAKGKGKPLEGEGDDDPLGELRAMLEAARTQEALSMAAKAAAMANKPKGSKAPRTNIPQKPNDSDEGAQEAGPGSKQTANADLAKLDPKLRAMILKMPASRTREELIRGLNEQGPEAYRAFIEDYFKRLAQTKPAPKK